MKRRFGVVGFCLIMSLSTTPAADKSVGTGPSFKGPIGLQLYSLRADFTRNVPTTLEKVKGYGIKYVETAGTYNLSATRFRECSRKMGWKLSVATFPMTGIATTSKTWSA